MLVDLTKSHPYASNWVHSGVYGFRRRRGRKLLRGIEGIQRVDRRHKSSRPEEVAETAYMFIVGEECYTERVSHTFRFDFSRVFKVFNPALASPRRSSGKMDSPPRSNGLLFDGEFPTSFPSERANI